jgi:hypothetical protein
MHKDELIIARIVSRFNKHSDLLCDSYFQKQASPNDLSKYLYNKSKEIVFLSDQLSNELQQKQSVFDIIIKIALTQTLINQTVYRDLLLDMYEIKMSLGKFLYDKQIPSVLIHIKDLQHYPKYDSDTRKRIAQSLIESIHSITDYSFNRIKRALERMDLSINDKIFNSLKDNEEFFKNNKSKFVSELNKL